ncbi:hypothetical protein [Pelomonas cellulosilytica]|uniref:Uncharacterized protein n=1 Tax=Pelomonas cellulosilytica TaxID=2906762 RepID=A0ABS8XJC9_9BURK|nr:hypothetical protein [Pelomonas sp. P8]MCE4552969.1 hypothetical protein [Pelomonas sp. P8]
MTTLSRMLIWLASLIGLGVLAWRLIAGQAGGEQVPALPPAAQAAPALPEAGPASAPLPALPTLPAASQAPASEPAREAFLKPPPDVMRLQRDIQFAISSNEPGKAGKAAQLIKRCEMLDQMRERLKAGGPMKVDDITKTRLTALLDMEAPACQAVDAASRAQLVPLLRRSVAEGDKGAAAALMSALGSNLDLAAEPDLVPALRRDAWDCDRPSLSQLALLARRYPQLLPPNEVGALREWERAGGARLIESMQKAASGPLPEAVLSHLMERFKPPAEADPAEVARLFAEIQSRCPVAAKPAP